MEVSYKIYAFVYDTGDSTHKWTELTCADGTSRMAKFGRISLSVENASRPYTFNADIGDIQLRDEDNYFGNLVTANLGLINTSDPIWQDWHYRPIRLDILNAAGTILYSTVACIDDLVLDDSSPTATIKTISLMRRAQDAKADAEQIFYGTDIYGAWGSNTTPTLYAGRTKNADTDEITRTWYVYRKASDIIKKTCAVLNDGVIEDSAGAVLTPDVDEVLVSTADGRRIVTIGPLPFDGTGKTSHKFCLYRLDGSTRLMFVAASDSNKSYLYKWNMDTDVWTLLYTCATDYYCRELFYNSYSDAVYMVSSKVQVTSPDWGCDTNITEYKLATGGVTTQALTGFYGTANNAFSGLDVGLKHGMFLFVQTRGTDGHGSVIFVAHDQDQYDNYDYSHAYSVGDKIQVSQDDQDDWYWLECKTAGTSAAYPNSPSLDSSVVTDGQDVVNGGATFTLHLRNYWAERNCYDIGGASWATDLIGSRIGLGMATDYRDMRVNYGIWVNEASNKQWVYGISFDGNNLFKMPLFAGDPVFSQWEMGWLKTGETFKEILNYSATLLFASTGGDLVTANKSTGVLTTLHSGADPYQVILAPDSRWYYIAQGFNTFWSTDGSSYRQENWLTLASEIGMPMFDMGDTGQQSNLVIDPATDWRIIGISQSTINAFFQFAKTDFGYLEYCDFSGMTIADVRIAIARRCGAVCYYDNQGQFHYVQRTRPSDASVKDFAEGECISLKTINSGRDKVINRVTYIPQILVQQRLSPFASSADMSVDGNGIIIDGSCNETADFKIVFSSATAYSLYKWNDGTSAWDLMTTNPASATRLTDVWYEYVCITNATFAGGQATAGDEVYFTAYPSQYEYTDLTFLDRIEIQDTASMQKYMTREGDLKDMKWVRRALAMDIMSVLLTERKDVHPVYSSVIPWEANLATIGLQSVVTFTSAKLGLTSAKKCRVNKIDLAQGSEAMQASIEAVDITIS